MSYLLIFLLFAAVVPSFVAENNPSPGWLRLLQRPLCSLLHSHNQREWEQRGCAHDVSTSSTAATPAFPSKPLFSLSTPSPSQNSQKHTMVVCLQGLAKDHKEMTLSHTSPLHREGYGMNYFSRMLGLIGPDNSPETAKAVENSMQTTDFANNGMRAADHTEYHSSSHQSAPWSHLSLNPTGNRGDNDDGVSVSDSCAEGDER